jgi:hypothetical protein
VVADGLRGFFVCIHRKASAMTESEEEENTSSRARGRPNKWWAEQNEEPQDTFTGSFRGVRPVHHGSQSVRADDTIGAVQYCHCGLLLHHDWLGKAQGLGHPTESEIKAMETRIDRTQIKAFNKQVQDVILAAVNDGGCKYRMLSNGIFLFPPDGSDPFKVNARSGTRNVGMVRDWFAKHVTIEESKADKVIEEVTTSKIETLAQTLNGPEHQPKQIKPKATQPKPAPKKPEPVAPPVQSDGEWTIYLSTRTGKPVHDRWETNGTIVRCKECIGTDHHYETPADKLLGLGGHVRIHHTEISTMYSPEARAKAAQTRQERLAQAEEERKRDEAKERKRARDRERYQEKKAREKKALGDPLTDEDHEHLARYKARRARVYAEVDRINAEEAEAKAAGIPAPIVDLMKKQHAKVAAAKEAATPDELWVKDLQEALWNDERRDALRKEYGLDVEERETPSYEAEKISQITLDTGDGDVTISQPISMMESDEAVNVVTAYLSEVRNSLDLILGTSVQANLEEENRILKAERDEFKTRAEEAETRLALLKEQVDVLFSS